MNTETEFRELTEEWKKNNPDSETNLMDGIYNFGINKMIEVLKVAKNRDIAFVWMDGTMDGFVIFIDGKPYEEQ